MLAEGYSAVVKLGSYMFLLVLIKKLLFSHIIKESDPKDPTDITRTLFPNPKDSD